MTLDEKKEAFSEKISAFHDQCAHWYSVHEGRRTGLLISSVIFTLCATGFGISGFSAHLQGYAGPLAALFSALNGAAITMLTTLKSTEQARYYGPAITACDELNNRLKYQVSTDAEFDMVFADFQALRRQEGNVSQADPKTPVMDRKRRHP